MRVRLVVIQKWFGDHAISIAIGAAVMLIALSTLLIVAIGRLDQLPSWWTQADAFNPNSPATIERAEQLENAISTQLTMIRDAQNPQWSVAINPEQANSWLAVRLIDTINTHQGEDAWPTQIERVRVGIVDDQLTIGLRARHDAGSVIFWGNARFELDQQGSLWAIISSTHIGNTPIPIWMIGLLSAQSRIQLGNSTLKLGDGRTAKLIAIRLNNDRLELVMETLADH